ncbi:MAG: hypothetical protein KDA68_02975 [Planctomycetaceae bacterium]|nr:hypothetical protein [Planctomycetaceae bacterium]
MLPGFDRWGGLVAGVLLILGASGCTMRQNVMWLPDSSGFVYPESGGHRISRYDLTTKKAIPVIGETGIYCTNPALNREGTRFAMAKYEVITLAATREVVTCEQVVIFNLQGEEVQRLPIHETRHKIDELNSQKKKNQKKIKVVDETETIDMTIDWSGPADRLLAGTTLYNLQTGTWKELKAMPLPTCWDRSKGEGIPGPIEHGFLGLAGKPEGSEEQSVFVFVDWEGVISEFQGNVPSNGPSTQIISFTWEGRTAKFRGSDGVHEYDTQRMVYTFVPDTEPKSTTGNNRSKSSMTYEFPTTSVVLKFSAVDEENEISEEQLVRIDPKTKAETILIQPWTLEEVRFFPAPDRRKMAVRGVNRKDDKQETIVVIDENGTILDQIPCAADSKKRSWIFALDLGEETEGIEK